MIDTFKNKITIYAKEALRFDDCRLTSPFVGEHLETYKKWIQDERHGDMGYLKNHISFKENPDLLLKNVKSAIVVIKSYKNTNTRFLKNPFKIARYAVGRDYHQVMGESLRELSDYLKSLTPSAECFVGVDSAPLAERSLAFKSGIGFLGKNSMVIKPGLGSYFFIGVVLTTLDLEEDKAIKWNCGECRLCIDACPTKAILSNYTLDAKRCLSYQTIEQKTPMTEDQIKKAKGWLFGCDICQEVCPYNHGNVPLTDWKEFLPQNGVGFDVFGKGISQEPLKDTPLYRSRKRLIPNWKKALTHAD